jgi:hypothetical protein
VWNTRGVLSVALQVLRLTGDAVRQRLLLQLGGDSQLLARIEQATPLVRRVLAEGPAAAWDEIKVEAAELEREAVERLRRFVEFEIVKQAVKTLVQMFVPGAGIVRAAVGIYDTIVFFIRRAADIARMVGGFLSSIGEIAAGNIDAAADALETGLARALRLVIDFLARFLRLNGIPARIRAVIEAVAGRAQAVVDRVVRWLVGLVRRGGQQVVGGAKRVVAAVTQWWRRRRAVGPADERHSLQFDGAQRSARLMVHSTPLRPTLFIEPFKTQKGTKAQRERVAQAEREIARLQGLLVAAQARAVVDEVEVARLDGLLTAEFNALGAALDTILSAASAAGGEDDPLPIDYPKRRAAAYGAILVGPATDEPLAQSRLRALPRRDAKQDLKALQPTLAQERGFKAWDGTVHVYSAAGGPAQKLPNGDVVGLAPQFASLAPGMRLRYDEKGSTGGGGKINRLFAPFGFRARAEGLDGDHVMERQIGGPDEVVNLWPLDKGENRSSGATVKSIEVQLKNRPVNVHEARRKRGKPALYLLIRKVRE